MWWNGPDWLSKDNCWRNLNVEIESLPMLKSNVINWIIIENRSWKNPINFENYSSFSKFSLDTAYVFTFFHNFKHKSKRKIVTFTLEEIEIAQ